MRSNLVAFLFAVVTVAVFAPRSAFAQKYVGIENWRYVPTDEKFWKEFTAKLDEGDLATAAKLTDIQLDGSQKPLEKTEAKMAQILVWEKAGQNVLAFHLSLEMIESSAGNMPGLQALVVAERLARTYGFDLTEARRIVNIGTFTEVPDRVMPFVSYLVAFDNFSRGYTEWAARHEAQLKDDSYWGALYHSQQLLAQLGTAPDEVGLIRLQAMRDKVKVFPSLKTNLDIQIARVLHRLKMYDAADKMYGSLDLSGRNYGRLLFERSWVRYNLLDYSVSLGLLESLKAPFFLVATDPEQYILAMIELRDLCHYPAVRKLTKEFTEVFGDTLKDIKTGKSLEKIPMLIRMVAQKMPYQLGADEISQLKNERRALAKNEKMIPRDLTGPAEERLDRLEKILSGRLARNAEDEFKAEAERLVTMNEQVKLIEYVSDLDEYRLSQLFEMRAYESEKAEKHATDGLFWPFVGEYWRDEMSNYRVLISDRCHTGKKEVR